MFNVRIYLTLKIILVLWGFIIAQEEEMWFCDDGQSIGRDGLCDGRSDCDDHSDEHFNNCMRKNECPKGDFKCNYGACIPKIKICDGKPDCRGGSDEVPVLCNKTTFWKILQERQEDCDDDFIKCGAECVLGDATCDNRSDCADNADESADLCLNQECQSNHFRCANGGCIRKNKICNGNNDCFDGSDEAIRMCNYTRIVMERRRTDLSDCEIPRKQHLNAKDSSGLRLESGNMVKDGAIIQFHCKDHFEWEQATGDRVLHIRCRKSKWEPTVPECVRKSCRIPIDDQLISTDLNTYNELEKNQLVDDNSCVSFSCAENYSFEKNVEAIEVLCVNNTWQRDIPKCLPKYCNATFLTSGYSTRPTCSYEGEDRDCTDIVHGYSADIKCAPGFKRSLRRSTSLFCNSEKRWEGIKYACQLKDCGKAARLSNNEHHLDISEAPWHVGIYRDVRVPVMLERKCSGTIITPKLVLSALHCFWDGANNMTFDAIYYYFVAGTARNIENQHAQDRYEQRILGTRFIYDEHYDPVARSYDITVVVLADAFNISPAVSPICINFREGTSKSLAHDTNVTVAAWFKNTTESIERLREFTLLYMEFKTCQREIRDNLRHNYVLKVDKICVKNAYGNMVNPGDSGAGLIERVVDGRNIRHFLEGVVSHAPIDSKSYIVTATSVQSYRILIEKAIKDYEDKDESEI